MQHITNVATRMRSKAKPFAEIEIYQLFLARDNSLELVVSVNGDEVVGILPFVVVFSSSIDFNDVVVTNCALVVVGFLGALVEAFVDVVASLVVVLGSVGIVEYFIRNPWLSGRSAHATLTACNFYHHNWVSKIVYLSFREVQLLFLSAEDTE